MALIRGSGVSRSAASFLQDIDFFQLELSLKESTLYEVYSQWSKKYSDSGCLWLCLVIRLR